jgi:hypothetical protein
MSGIALGEQEARTNQYQRQCEPGAFTYQLHRSVLVHVGLEGSRFLFAYCAGAKSTSADVGFQVSILTYE